MFVCNVCDVGAVQLYGHGACVYGELGVSNSYYKVYLYGGDVQGKAGEGFWTFVGHCVCRQTGVLCVIYRPYCMEGAE